jgi:hypothetical protein
MNLLKRKPVGRPGGHRSTLVIYVDCDEEDFAWVQKNCVKAVEDYLDEAFSQMMVFPEGDIQLSWLRAAGPSETGPDELTLDPNFH